MPDDILSTIKNTILDAASKKNVPIEKIILFGSRARGDYTHKSDWDIVIITTTPLKKPLFWDLYIEIKKRELTKNKIPADIIIIPKSIFEKKKRVVGNVAYYANKEGKIIWRKSSKRSKDGLKKQKMTY